MFGNKAVQRLKIRLRLSKAGDDRGVIQQKYQVFGRRIILHRIILPAINLPESGFLQFGGIPLHKRSPLGIPGLASAEGLRQIAFIAFADLLGEEHTVIGQHPGDFGRMELRMPAADHLKESFRKMELGRLHGQEADVGPAGLFPVPVGGVNHGFRMVDADQKQGRIRHAQQRLAASGADIQ